MQGPVLDALSNQRGDKGSSLPVDQEGYILFENKILGNPRLRQLRVSPALRIDASGLSFPQGWKSIVHCA